MVLLFSALGLLAAIVVYDLLQRQHAILRNFPIIGHFRYWLEAVGPELRQYIVTNNNEERPFSRDQRRWVYASSKQENTSFGFGSDPGDGSDSPITSSSSTRRFRCRRPVPATRRTTRRARLRARKCSARRAAA